ncbi:GNAT family N-acetyltransferase [Cohnella candidum]|uniref:GNAT family N-acetyltransferase n=1 Tax=Cohnella candidum TaxID=2674991 RepID=A0A3G3JWU1_9BACL|nr:GNAT family N-acetyltransferase [Cohnella candidum]AYQ72321.1 GNAT family N-acetyltransferase [Cohnella candidum]
MDKSGITIEILQDGNIEICRDLCNELMAFQKSKATMAPEKFDAMNFDTRMKRSYELAKEKQVIVAKADGVPIGYAFSTIDVIERGKLTIPEWAPNRDQPGVLGFYPDWEHLPERVGCLSNLYIRDGYRHLGLGSKLFRMSMEWMASFPDVECVFIYVSNGNREALDFYLKHGFLYSHDVFGGFIQAVCKFIK